MSEFHHLWPMLRCQPYKKIKKEIFRLRFLQFIMGDSRYISDCNSSQINAVKELERYVLYWSSEVAEIMAVLKDQMVLSLGRWQAKWPWKGGYNLDICKYEEMNIPVKENSINRKSMLVCCLWSRTARDRLGGRYILGDPHFLPRKFELYSVYLCFRKHFLKLLPLFLKVK